MSIRPLTFSMLGCAFSFVALSGCSGAAGGDTESAASALTGPSPTQGSSQDVAIVGPVTATATSSLAQASLAWTFNQTDDVKVKLNGFYIYECTTPNDGCAFLDAGLNSLALNPNYHFVAAASGSSSPPAIGQGAYTLSGLRPSTNYTIAVAAYNDTTGTDFFYAGTTSFTTLPATGVPAPVADLVAHSTSSSPHPTLIWENVSFGQTGVAIERSSDGVHFTALAKLGLVDDYADETAVSGQTYTYQVISETGTKTGAAATVKVTVATPAVATPAAPPNWSCEPVRAVGAPGRGLDAFSVSVLPANEGVRVAFSNGDTFTFNDRGAVGASGVEASCDGATALANQTQCSPTPTSISDSVIVSGTGGSVNIHFANGSQEGYAFCTKL